MTVDWENGYVEASAKDNTNVIQVSYYYWPITNELWLEHSAGLRDIADIQGIAGASQDCV